MRFDDPDIGIDWGLSGDAVLSEKDQEKVKGFFEKVVAEQIKASLLVNPRPTQEEFTKYSFPSKNMEYMVSGTPIVTTKLPGMPAEYNDFVYLFDDETVPGMSQKINELLGKSAEELHHFGSLSKSFVLGKKNNVVQAKGILNFLDTAFKS